jgi:hypothetical protein
VLTAMLSIDSFIAYVLLHRDEFFFFSTCLRDYFIFTCFAAFCADGYLYHH